MVGIVVPSQATVFVKTGLCKFSCFSQLCTQTKFIQPFGVALLARRPPGFIKRPIFNLDTITGERVKKCFIDTRPIFKLNTEFECRIGCSDKFTFLNTQILNKLMNTRHGCLAHPHSTN